ncbi:dienelactone hydrolase family protein [Corynebacterium alimapuense]|uniref:Alpha/beta hydrolase n=1 Tax=Corynebacterium alimapuense TaxID=1576874 RepID=A0A3M8K6J4_9CORY|nr:dienelactone hydrolase family protein [Corynebacterium alimapuense]RNE48847.1 alpha/beta hydrolase [Corynebacterium alimapuense]
MSENLKKHLAQLSKRGPHRVLVGDLSYAGMAGKVYAPAEGSNVPAIAFGHDWLRSVKAYHATLRHLASWGIVVVAPDTESGLIPDHRGFSADLETALQIAAGVKLGNGNVTVSPGKLGIAGHGMGAGAAILAAAGNPTVKAVGALYPAVTAPPVYAAAQSVQAPGLIIGSGKKDLFDAGNPARIAENWAGTVAYREMTKGSQLGFSEGAVLRMFLGIGRSQNAAQETARGLLTGFLLHQLDSQKKYAGFSAALAEGKHFESFTGSDLSAKAGPQAESTPLSLS